MNPYAILATANDSSESAPLSDRLKAWHDAMVAHERRLRAGQAADACDDECPHGEARHLWAEALEAFGPRAQDLTFLRTRASAAAPTRGAEDDGDDAFGSTSAHTAARAEL
jgi:hypothetical protein